ncbi:MAG TPA: SDR family oxidoreductase [Dinghuibacter sp.]|jgi:3-oxoacyl-[acyl-carrier protein] reductase|uniref:SDR family NAD(P)-dependent oxidoreductase n=1 Tax=Dinghuibacter sp. TaxID=2024697 RepID=UPI002D070FED|nr:SDR family oxidoreductase [Dinghuibacter sp.]HTJ10962.1 SDR family oxidoreductase [Dinghuibacter sp.]
MTLDFKGKTVLVTGATRGIGQRIADDLGRLGARLILTGTKPEQIAELNARAPASTRYYCVDLLDRDSLDTFLRELDAYERIDGLVNNAGINRLNSVGDILEGDWDDMLEVNLTAPFRLLKHVSRRMVEGQYGRVVQIASIFSKVSKERRATYSATKFGLHGLTVGASNDLARYNILINTLSPGFVMTDLTRKNLSPEEISALSAQVPAKRFAETGDISSVAVFLLSDLNQYLTGQNIFVDGGFTNV